MTTKRFYLCTLPLLMGVFCLFSLSIGTTDTIAVYSDKETSEANYLRADPVDFSVNLEGPRELEVGEDAVSITPIISLEPDSLPTEYRVVAKTIGGDTNFCNALSIYTTTPLVYTGLLAALQTDTTSELGPWTLTVEVLGNGVVPDGAVCEIYLVYTGWEVGHTEGEGYTDEEIVALSFVYRAPPVASPAALEPASDPAPEVLGVQSEETLPVDTPVEPPATETPPPHNQQESPAESAPLPPVEIQQEESLSQTTTEQPPVSESPPSAG